AHAQPRTDPGRFLDWVGQDTRSLLGDFDLKHGLYVASGVALLFPISLLDQAVNPAIQERYHGAFATYIDVANELGGPRVNLPIAAVFAASLAIHDRKLQDAAFTSLESFLFAGMVSYALKYPIGRARPEEGMGPRHFAPFSGHTSMPSGHTVAAFAIVTPWVVYYPHPVTFGLYVLSTGTALARMERDKHWISDVAAGAAIGTATGYWLATRHRRLQHALTLTPTAGPNALGLTLTARF
ncbi:MAG TPA: phosphatase PAP2 family protein, partial [Rhodothermales bacterium]|nr:phosphatase PAP2 family protein [Rhodothermales bacterium]